MKIEQEEALEKSKKQVNIYTVITVLIIITCLIVIGIIILISNIRDDNLKLIVDGKRISYKNDTFLFKEGTEEIYVSISDIAPLVGYDAHNRGI